MPNIHFKTAQGLEYEFSFETKYLILTGDSGNGKSTLVNLVERYSNHQQIAECLGDKNVSGLLRLSDLDTRGMIYFIDENNQFLWDKNISKLLNHSDNYFVIVTRDRKISQVKLPLDAFVQIVVSNNGFYHTIRPLYPKTEQIYTVGDLVVCEDKGSGREFLQKVLNTEVISAGGDKRIGVTLRKLGKKEYTIVYDRAGIGYAYQDQLVYLKHLGIGVVSEIDWDCFEAYILESSEYEIKVPIFPDKEKSAYELFKRHIDGSYDKAKLPEKMKFPVYGKVEQLAELLLKKQETSSGK